MQQLQPRTGRTREAAFLGSIAVQAVLVALGAVFFITENPSTSLIVLLFWCGLGTVYAVVVLVGISRSLRANAITRPLRRELSRPTRVLTVVSTILTSGVGVGAATQLALQRNDIQFGLPATVVGIWAILVSWGLLHWGFAQMYRQQYFTAIEPTIHFPSTPDPGIVEFVYFSYTIGSSFAASDVEVVSSSLRWRVVWHSVLSFGFNGLIVVFAFTTIFAPL